MKFLKYMFFAFLVTCLSCSSSKNTHSETQPQETYEIMFNVFEGYYSKCQLDSICIADTLDMDLNNWIVVPLKDYETKKNVSQYVYIKSLGKHETIYRVYKIDDNSYKITKRITE